MLDADPRSPERGQYAFVQALIREVAYGTLSRRDRKARHLAAARFFEGLGSDELAGALAGHYLAAHADAAEGPEADALAGQARLALRGAAERAAALGAHDQAVMFLEQALTVTADTAEQAELLDRAGREAVAAGPSRGRRGPPPASPRAAAAGGRRARHRADCDDAGGGVADGSPSRPGAGGPGAGGGGVRRSRVRPRLRGPRGPVRPGYLPERRCTAARWR